MSNNFAIIKTGGKQYKVAVGDKLKVEKLLSARPTEAAAKRAAGRRVGLEEGKLVSFDEVLLRSIDGKVFVGAPLVSGAAVEAKLLKHDKERTKIVFKYHAKARYRKKKGHRQEYTEVEITKI